ncbi:MAG: hypothetical protein ACRD9Y_11315, partial [Blastocatellia bacterium]
MSELNRIYSPPPPFFFGEQSGKKRSAQTVKLATWEWLAQLAKDNLRRSLFSILFGCLILAFGIFYPFLLALAEKYYLLKPRAPISDFYSIWLVVISFSVAGVY